MNTIRTAGAAVLALTAIATASPFSQLKFDINEMDVTFTSGANGTGAALPTVSAGGGLNFTGSWGMKFIANSTFVDITGNNLTGGAGPFANAGAATLVGVGGYFNFVNGVLTGGNFVFTVNAAGGGTETIQGTFANSGTSFITGSVPNGPWFVTGLVVNATFTDNGTAGIFGTSVDITKFINQTFGGTFSQIFVSNDGTNGDFDMIITIPNPAAASMGVLGLVGVAGLRRRRSL